MKLVVLLSIFVSLNANAGVVGDLIDQAQKTQGGKVFVFDLDETLIDSTPRKYISARDAIEHVCIEYAPPPRSGCWEHPECEDLRKLSVFDLYQLDNRYDLKKALEKQIAHTENNCDPFNLDWVLDRSLKYYLSDSYIQYDLAYFGAVSFVKQLKQAGAEVYFVSSRSLERQNSGTRESLLRLGFITERNDPHVILKSDAQSSIDFKTQTFEKIRVRAVVNQAKVLGVFENEPENMNAMMKVFPQATAVFVRGAFIKNVPLEGKPILINDYLEYR